MKLVYPGVELLEVLIVDDDVVRGGQAYVAGGLGAHDVFHLLFGVCVARHGAGQLQIFGYVDDQHSIAPGLLASFDQERIDEHDVIRLSRGDAERTVFDDGKRDTLKGGKGRDWLFANLDDDDDEDRVLDRNPNELIDDVLAHFDA